MKYLATELSKVKVYTQIEHNLVKQDTIKILNLLKLLLN